MVLSAHELALADGRPGNVEWSDGHKLGGEISLTPGKDLRLFTATGQVSIHLDEVKELRFKPEKEEMSEGFYFPNAGQATQAKTGEAYPTRTIQTQITLADGKVLEGHLFTTTLYVETDANTEKVVLMAKQTGTDNQKLTDLIYPTLIHFDRDAASAGSSQIDLTQASLTMTKPAVVVAKPDLALLPLQQIEGKSAWTVPSVDPTQILFSVEAKDGIHVAWPFDPVAGNMAGPADAPPFPKNPVYLQLNDSFMAKALETSLTEMQDFYDTRTLLGCVVEGNDVYSLVMMKRIGPTNGFSADRIPWSLVILRWKYDSDEKKTTLLNRVSLAMGRAEGNSSLPTVFIQPELLRDISAVPAPTPQGTHP
jgi:hypothetical protein